MATAKIFIPPPTAVESPVFHDAVTLTNGVGPSADLPQQRQPRTIAELIDIRAEELPSQPIVSYPFSGVEYVDYTYFDLQRYSKNASGSLASHMTLRQASTEPEMVVAILGPSDFDYLINALALSRLGCTVLFLSTRISDAAYSSLLTATNCSNIIYYPKFSETIETLKKSIPTLSAIERLTNQQYSESTAYVANPLDLAVENGKISWVIHSSGSTGMPKPIYQTHNAALRKYVYPQPIYVRKQAL
jgi:acyl-CoA synthetase (AMP-forming)/AMP-acid ligase II